MNSWALFLENRVLISAVTGWAVAQVMKTLLHLCITRSFDPERLVGGGGMPSSHSATVCALSTTTLLKYGASSFEFAIAAVLALIVMYDAMNVRLETGRQAKLLNEFLETFKKLEETSLTKFSTEKLKEFVGHTPIQVLAGAVLGIVVGILFQ